MPAASSAPPSSIPLSANPQRRPLRPGMSGRQNSFQKQLVTNGPTPPSLLHSPYLDSPQSIFNGGPGRRHERTRLTPPNEHDKLGLLDTVPIGASSSGGGSAGGGSRPHPQSSSSAPLTHHWAGGGANGREIPPGDNRQDHDLLRRHNDDYRRR